MVVGWLDQVGIRLSQLSTKLKLKLSLVIVMLGQWSMLGGTMACHPLGHIIHRGISSTGAYHPPGHSVSGAKCLRGIVSWGIVSPGA